MAREKQGYRDNLELITRKIEARYPDSLGVLTAEEAADFLNCNVKTVHRLIGRRVNPLPAQNIGTGRNVWRIPITALASWTLG